MSIDQWRTRPHSTAVDRLFLDALAPYFSNGTSTAASGGTTGFQSLPLNVWETVEGYEATFLAPGLDEQSINVTVHDDTLAIEGELRFEVPEGARWCGKSSARPHSVARFGWAARSTRPK
jgi:HSP20 family molecular chaperone IbpA